MLVTHFGRRAGGQERVEVGEALAEALPPQPLAHDVPEPRAAARPRRLRRRRPHKGSSLVVRGRRVHSSGRGAMTNNASQVTEHPPVHVRSGAGPPAARHHQARLEQRRAPAPALVRLERAARGQLRREDQGEAHQVVLVVGLVVVDGHVRRALTMFWSHARPRLYTYRRGTRRAEVGRGQTRP